MTYFVIKYVIIPDTANNGIHSFSSSVFFFFFFWFFYADWVFFEYCPLVPSLGFSSPNISICDFLIGALFISSFKPNTFIRYFKLVVIPWNWFV